MAGNLASASQLAALAKMDGGRGMQAPATMPTSGYSASPGTFGEEDLAQCLGLAPAEFRDFTDPTHGAPRQPTKKELDRQAKLSRKVDMQRYQSCMMTQQAAAMHAESSVVPTGAGRRGTRGRRHLLRSRGRAAQGHTTVRGIGWAPGEAELSRGSDGAFSEAMTQLALALRQAGGTYRMTSISSPRWTRPRPGSSAPLGSLRSRRRSIMQAFRSGLVTSGKTKVDKDGRLEFVRAKR